MVLEMFKQLNETGIPKFFWYTVGIAIFSVNIGIIFILAKAQELKIEYANTKVQIITSVAQLDHAYTDLQKQIESLKPSQIITAQATSTLDDLGRQIADLKLKSSELQKSLFKSKKD
jgi:cell division protein FtsL